jgi:hypothetical protein
MDMVRAGLGYLAVTDPTRLATEEQAQVLRELERHDAVATAARARCLAAFTAAQGHCGDGDFSPRAWLMHQTGITRGAAAGHTAWARRAGGHRLVLAALAAGQISESYGPTAAPDCTRSARSWPAAGSWRPSPAPRPRATTCAASPGARSTPCPAPRMTSCPSGPAREAGNDPDLRAAALAVVTRSGAGGMIQTVSNDPIFEFDVLRVDTARWLDIGQPGTRPVRRTWQARR